MDRLEALGVGCDIVTGGTSSKVRERVFADFRAGDGPPWLVLTQCAQAGVQLQRAQVTVVCEIPWEAKAQAQATARMWRQGQTMPTHEYTLAWDHDVDQHVLESCHIKNNDIARMGF
jgi:SNF2 family DNA or RNA helicase